MENEEIDYQAYMRETQPNPALIVRGAEARQQRWQAAMAKPGVQIEEDLLQQFRQMIPAGQSCESIINQALREWLFAKGMKEMVRAEVQIALRQSLSAVQQTAE
jgi:hypothetical protein